MAHADWEPRPDDDAYYADRAEYVRQGDLFREVPVGYPFPPDAVDHAEGRRKFFSGPFDSGFGLLLSPTCSMAAQGAPGKYAHPFRVIAPVLPLDQLADEGAIKRGSISDIRRYDPLVNYFYVPTLEAAGMPESLALLYAPTTIHHDYLEGHRVAQLSVVAAIHLKRQLAAHVSGLLASHDDYADE